jgi:histidinol-phosphate aminotransferase
MDDRLSRYPTTYSLPLREAIAAYVGVSADEIMVGAGSDEVMSCAFRALGNPGDTVAYMDPTFVMTRIFAATNSLTPLAIPLAPDGDADGEAMVRARARLTYVCTPNNPTGIPVARAVLDRILGGARGLVLVDEAYAEYAGTNLAREAPAHGRMLVLRTFSKAFGLAGMRIGFAVGSRALIAELEKARGPYTVTSLGERAALAALTEDLPWVERGVTEVRECRDRFAAALCAAGFAPLPSAANFVLVPVRDAHGAMRALRQCGILVRHFTRLAGIGDALRITVGSERTMERVIGALRTASIEPARSHSSGNA